MSECIAHKEKYTDVKIKENMVVTATRAYTNQNNRYDTMARWLKDNCTGKTIIGLMYVSFEDKNDAFAFKLKWG